MNAKRMLRPHLKVLIGLFIIVISAVVYLVIGKRHGNTKAVQEGDTNHLIHEVLDTLQYDEAIYDSMRSFFITDSTLMNRPNADKDELIKLRQLLSKPYEERYGVATESDIKMLILVYQHLKGAKTETQRMGHLKRILSATDVDTSDHLDEPFPEE